MGHGVVCTFAEPVLLCQRFVNNVAPSDDRHLEVALHPLHRPALEDIVLHHADRSDLSQQLGEHLRIIVDASKQHRLVFYNHACTAKGPYCCL